MKWSARFLAFCLLGCLVMQAPGGQESGPSKSQEQPQQQQQQQEQQQQEQERPTLGPKSGPAVESGPQTSTTTDLRKLLRIHTIYIENIDNALSDKLVEALGKWGRFRLVTKPKDADATLRGSCLESRRLKHVHSEVFISDRNGASVWQDNIYRPFNPPTLEQAVNDTASIVVAHLEQTVQAGERR